jgi:hypothetical protein
MPSRRGSSPKSRKPSPSKKPRGAGAKVAPEEWIGGRVLLGNYVTDEAPFRPTATLWVESDSQLVVHASLGTADEASGTLGTTLLETIAHPMAGPPRVPRQVRVTSAAFAAELLGTPGFPMDVKVVVAPTPELEGLVAQMTEHLATHGGEGAVEPSYLEEGTIPAERVATLFEVASRLYRLAPWDRAWDDQLLGLDVPVLGVGGARISVIGIGGESLGLVFFESLAAFEALMALQSVADAPPPVLDLGSSLMALDFVRASELPPRMVKEVKKHRWPLPARGVYPVVTRRDHDGTPRPTTEADVRLATAGASAICALVEQRPAIFDEALARPVAVTTSTSAQTDSATLTAGPWPGVGPTVC